MRGKRGQAGLGREGERGQGQQQPGFTRPRGLARRASCLAPRGAFPAAARQPRGARTTPGGAHAHAQPGPGLPPPPPGTCACRGVCGRARVHACMARWRRRRLARARVPRAAPGLLARAPGPDSSRLRGRGRGLCGAGRGGGRETLWRSCDPSTGRERRRLVAILGGGRLEGARREGDACGPRTPSRIHPRGRQGSLGDGD